MSLEIVFVAEQRALRRRLRRMTGDEETAADLCQETFARAWARARDLLGARVRVRSGHHQGVRRVGARRRVTATSPDGLVEGMERTDRRFAVGVQWRPQTDPDAAGNQRLAEALVTAAARRRP